MADLTSLVTIDMTTLSAIIAAGGCAAAAIYAAYLKGKNAILSGNTTATLQPVPVQTTGAPLNVPETNIYDPAKHGGKGPAFVPWEQMRQWVAFKTTEVTRMNLLAGIVDQTDRDRILNAIKAAEAANEYKYTIAYSKGYYQMQAVCEPIGTNEYKYQVILSGSGSDKQ